MTTQTDSLTIQLNTLLQAVDLPFILQSPTDLTPSLLLAILESILHVRIPFERGEHIQTVKVFLGILETDVLKTDVGLSQIDPRLLAIGARDETIYVAEVLCWIGQELGLVPPTPVVPDAPDSDEGTSSIIPPSLSLGLAQYQPTSQIMPQEQIISPSSTITFLPPFTDSSPPTTSTLLFSTEPNDTIHTTMTSLLTTSFMHGTSPRQATALTPPSIPLPPPPRIPPSLNSIPPDDSSFSRQTPPIRRSGHISLVDYESELSAFYSCSRSPKTPRYPSQQQTMFSTSQPSSRRKPKRGSPTSRRSFGEGDSQNPDWRDLLSQSQDYDPRRTYELLQLRSQLMEELVRIRMNQRS